MMLFLYYYLSAIWFLFCLVVTATAPTGTRCFSCPNIAKPIDCTHQETCKNDEECSTYERHGNGSHVSYAMGCRSKQACDVIRNTPLIGRRATGTRCEECCSSSFLCNNKLCAVSTTTTDTFASLHLTVKPDVQTTMIGGSAVFECGFNTKVNQSMKMTWSFTNTTSTTHSIYSVAAENPPRLLINVKSAQINDSGVYTCTVELGSHRWSAGGRLVVPGYLNITTPPRTQTVMSGGRATFVCDAIGDPTPVIHWQSLIGVAITNVTSAATVTSSGSKLVIDNVTTVDEGFYTCIASSAFGSTEEWAVLAVIDNSSAFTTSSPTPESTAIHPLPTDLANWHLKVSPTSVNMKAGETAKFECRFDVVVNETIAIKWSFTNTTGHTLNVYSGKLDSPDLIFSVKHIDKTDSGTYTCEASLGNTTWTAKGTLTVSG